MALSLVKPVIGHASRWKKPEPEPYFLMGRARAYGVQRKWRDERLCQIQWWLLNNVRLNLKGVGYVEVLGVGWSLSLPDSESHIQIACSKLAGHELKRPQLHDFGACVVMELVNTVPVCRFNGGLKMNCPNDLNCRRTELRD